jgi:hypothetical protein
MRRLPGPAVDRPGDGGDSRGSRQSCFGTGSEHKLNPRRGLCGVLDRKWMSGSARKQEPSAESRDIRRPRARRASNLTPKVSQPPIVRLLRSDVGVAHEKPHRRQPRPRVPMHSLLRRELLSSLLGQKPDVSILNYAIHCATKKLLEALHCHLSVAGHWLLNAPTVENKVARSDSTGRVTERSAAD